MSVNILYTTMVFQEGWTHNGYNKKTGRPEFVGDEHVDSVIDELLGNSPTGRLWSLLWEWKDIDGTKHDMGNCGNLSKPSLYKVLPTFLKYEWVIPSRKVGGIQYYKLNLQHYLVKQMLKVIDMHIEANVHIISAEEEVKDKLALKYKNKKKKPKVKKTKKKGP